MNATVQDYPTAQHVYAPEYAGLIRRFALCGMPIEPGQMMLSAKTARSLAHDGVLGREVTCDDCCALVRAEVMR